MQVSEILQKKGHDVVSLSGDANMLEASVLLAAKRIGAVLITDPAGKIAGILSERDVVRALASESVRALAAPVTHYMTRAVAACAEFDTVEKLMAMMTEGRFRHMPVLDGEGKLTGLVSIGDVVKAHVEETAREAANLREYIAAAG